MYFHHTPDYLRWMNPFDSKAIVSTGYINAVVARSTALNHPMHYIYTLAVGKAVPEHQQVPCHRLSGKRNHGNAMLPTPDKRAHASAEGFRH